MIAAAIAMTPVVPTSRSRRLMADGCADVSAAMFSFPTSVFFMRMFSLRCGLAGA